MTSILYFVFAMFNGNIARGINYSNYKLELKDTTSIDSIFYKHVKVSYGAYYNLLMGRYFALDDYKGVKSTTDAGISLRNIYSENIPIVLLGDYKIPLLLFDYSSSLSTIDRIDSVKFIKNSKTPSFLEKFYSPNFADTLIVYTNKNQLKTKSDFGINSSILNKMSLPLFDDSSPIDSILIKVLGYNLNQIYNKGLSDYYIIHYSPFNKLSADSTLKNVSPVSMKTITGDLNFGTGRYIDTEGKCFGVKIFINGLPIIFYHQNGILDIDSIHPKSYKLEKEKSYDSWFDYVKKIYISTK